jgi:hypothetical protein
MSKPLYSWLFQSVYYSVNNQKELLQKIIAPNLSRYEKQGMVFRYLLYMGSEQGEHLRLAIACFPETRELFFKEFHSLLADHMQRCVSVSANDDYRGKDIFMLFENNRIYYNLFEINTAMDETMLNFGSGLSRLMIDYFSGHDPDIQGQRLFLFYTLISFCAVWEEMYDNLSSVLADIIAVAKSAGGTYSGAYFENYGGIFLENKDKIEALCRLVFDDTQEDVWPVAALKQLFRTCLTERPFGELTDPARFERINEVIVKHMNIDTDDIAGICHLLNVSIGSFKAYSG